VLLTRTVVAIAGPTPVEPDVPATPPATVPQMEVSVAFRVRSATPVTVLSVIQARVFWTPTEVALEIPTAPPLLLVEKAPVAASAPWIPVPVAFRVRSPPMVRVDVPMLASVVSTTMSAAREIPIPTDPSSDLEEMATEPAAAALTVPFTAFSSISDASRIVALAILALAVSMAMFAETLPEKLTPHLESFSSLVSSLASSFFQTFCNAFW